MKHRLPVPCVPFLSPLQESSDSSVQPAFNLVSLVELSSILRVFVASPAIADLALTSHAFLRL